MPRRYPIPEILRFGRRWHRTCYCTVVAPSFGSVGRIPTELHAAPAIAGLRYEARSSDDVDQHASHLSRWRQQYDQISRGRFQGRVRELWLEGPRLQVFHEYTGQQTSQQCEPWAGAIWFGVPDGRSTSDVHFCGRRQAWGQGHAVLRAADAGFALHTPREFGIYGVAVDEAWLQQQLDRLHLATPRALVQARGVSPAIHVAICESVEAMLRLSAAGDGDQPWGRMALQAMIDHLLRLLSNGEEDASTMIGFDLGRRRWATVMKARELVSRPLNHAMTVDDLCAQLHVTRRTLQNHFQRVVGESPADFLKAVRLNACRRRLREAAAVTLTVQEVAAQWGFFHMGHFSADYKAMFGELPSQTLRQAQPARSGAGPRRPIGGRWMSAPQGSGFATGISKHAPNARDGAAS